MIIGYARVSTDDQNLDAQTDALKAAGCERIFADKISGSVRSRPELDKLLDQLRDGDVIVVTKYDRLARSLRDLLEIVETIKERGGGLPLARRGYRHHHLRRPARSSTSSPRSRSSSGKGFQSERAKALKLPSEEAGLVAGPLPSRQRRSARSAACGMMKVARFKRLPVCSR